MKRSPIRHIALAVAAASALLNTSQTARAQETHKTKSGIIVTDWTFNPKDWRQGMTVHRFELENTKSSRQTVRISIPGERYVGYKGIRKMTAIVTVEGQSKAAVTMPQPPMNLSGGSSFIIHSDGAQPEYINSSVTLYNRWYHLSKAPALLLSRTLSSEALDAALQPTLDKLPPVVSSSQSKLESTRLIRDPQAWPGSWIDYSPFDGCLVGKEDFIAMPTEVRVALLDYVSAGGVLALVGMAEFPADINARAEPGGARGLQTANVGLGKVMAIAESGIAAWDEETRRTLLQTCIDASTWIKRTTPPQSMYVSPSYGATIEKCMEAIPLGMSLGVPVNFTVFLLVLFATLAGPVAVVVAARRNRRIALLWAVPAFSLVFSTIIFISMLLSEGITPTQRKQAITLLDQDTRQTITLGAVGVYSPTTLRNGISFEYSSEITPLIYTDLNDADIEFGQRQQYSGGWTPPRMASFFRLRRSERRAERLVVEEGADGKVAVVNALGAPIEWLRLYDAQGNPHEASGIAAGARVELRRVKDSNAGGSPATSGQNQIDWVKERLSSSQDLGWAYVSMAKEAEQNTDLAEPLTYVAKLSGCPFMENPLDGFRAKGTAEAIVLGKFSAITGDGK